MNQKALFIIIILLLIANLAFSALKGKDTDKEIRDDTKTTITQPQIIDTAVTPPAFSEPTGGKVTKLSIILDMQNNSGITGMANLEEVNGKVVVRVQTIGDLAATQPAHLHSGSCKNLGDIKYSLNSVTEGGSTTMLSVSMSELIKNFPLAVNIHKSADKISTYVACGDLR